MKKTHLIAVVCILAAIIIGIRLAGDNGAGAQEVANQNVVMTQVATAKENPPKEEAHTDGYQVTGKLRISISGDSPNSDAPPDKIFNAIELAQKAQIKATKEKEEKK